MENSELKINDLVFCTGNISLDFKALANNPAYEESLLAQFVASGKIIGVVEFTTEKEKIIKYTVQIFNSKGEKLINPQNNQPIILDLLPEEIFKKQDDIKDHLVKMIEEGVKKAIIKINNGVIDAKNRLQKNLKIIT